MEGDGDVELGLGPAVLEGWKASITHVTALHVWNT